MKKLLLSTAMIMTFGVLFGQEYTAKVTEKGEPDKKLTTLVKERIYDYTADVYISSTKENIESLNLYHIEQVIYLNGKEMDTPMKTYFKKASEKTIIGKIDVKTIITDYSHLVKEKGNTVKVEFLDEDNRHAKLCEVEFKVDVFGFNNYESQFCGKLSNLKSTNKQVDKTLHTIFKAVYPHEKIVLTLMGDEWDQDDLSDQWNFYYILFENKGSLWRLKYTTKYVKEDGKLIETPRVYIYNGLSDPVRVPDSCYESLKENLK